MNDFCSVFVLFLPILIVACLTLRASAGLAVKYPRVALRLLWSAVAAILATVMFFVFVISRDMQWNVTSDIRFGFLVAWSVLTATSVLFLSRAVNANRPPIDSPDDDED